MPKSDVMPPEVQEALDKYKEEKKSKNFDQKNLEEVKEEGELTSPDDSFNEEEQDLSIDSLFSEEEQEDPEEDKEVSFNCGNCGSPINETQPYCVCGAKLIWD